MVPPGTRPLASTAVSEMLPPTGTDGDGVVDEMTGFAFGMTKLAAFTEDSSEKNAEVPDCRPAGVEVQEAAVLPVHEREKFTTPDVVAGLIPEYVMPGPA